MKKISLILCAFVLLLLVKLSFDVYGLSKENSLLQSRLDQIELNHEHLNDQLVAIQRIGSEGAVTTSSQPRPAAPTVTQSEVLSPIALIKQQLEFIQFALQQQQYVYALDKFRLLDQSIDKYQIADSLKQSAHQAIQQDYDAVQKFVLMQQSQQQQMLQLLSNLSEEIELQAHSTLLSPAEAKSDYFWKKWFQVDRIHQRPELGQRQLILKDVKFQILLAEQAFLSHQYQSYLQRLEAAEILLNKVPDAGGQKLKQNVLKLKQMKKLSVPQLKTHSIFG